MVASKGDIPERDEVAPASAGKYKLLEELLDRGETIVHLVDGSTVELHGYDTHLFSSGVDSVVYTQTESEDEKWFFTSEIVSLDQH